MSTGVSLTLEQDGRKSGGAMPQVRKVEMPLTPLAAPVLSPMVNYVQTSFLCISQRLAADAIFNNNFAR